MSRSKLDNAMRGTGDSGDSGSCSLAAAPSVGTVAEIFIVAVRFYCT